MRKVDTSAVSSTNGMPVKAGTIQHLQLAYQEALTALANNIIGRALDSTHGYILYGCVNSGSTGSMNVSAGAIYYNGEVFLVDAFTLLVSVGVAVASISETFYGTDADPVTFTDGVARNVHSIRKLVFKDAASGSGLFDWDNRVQTAIVLYNDQQATLGATYTVKFDQDRAIFFTSATVDTAITFDFTNAVPGACVRLKWTYGAGRALTISVPSGATVIKDSGTLASVASNTNLLYAIYLGKNDAGNDEVSYILKQV